MKTQANNELTAYQKITLKYADVFNTVLRYGLGEKWGVERLDDYNLVFGLIKEGGKTYLDTFRELSLGLELHIVTKNIFKEEYTVEFSTYSHRFDIDDTLTAEYYKGLAALTATTVKAQLVNVFEDYRKELKALYEEKEQSK